MHRGCADGFSRVKMHWADMEATRIATRRPTGSQDPVEHYFEQVIEGARRIEAQCSKNVMFE